MLRLYPRGLHRGSIDMAWRALFANRMRAALTILGVTIGIAAVIAMMALVQGLRGIVALQMANLAPNAFFVSKQPHITLSVEEQREAARRPNLTFDMLAEVLKVCPHVRQGEAAASVMPPGPVRRRRETTERTFISGATPGFLEVKGYGLATGRSIDDADVEHHRHVAMIGADVVRQLFPQEPPLGADVEVAGLRYTVIGTLAPRGAIFGQSMDDVVALPLTQFLDQYPETQEMLGFGFLPTDAASLTRATDEVTSALRRIRGLPYWVPNNFDVETQAQLMQGFNALTGGAFALMIAVGAISLLVGGIGIMNIMLVSVTERTHEIGLRKAVGATRVDIFAQFLVEACVLSFGGGVVGILVGLAIAQVLRLTTSLPVSVPVWVMFVAAGVAITVGVIFGTYPAQRAARLMPIDALRYE